MRILWLCFILHTALASDRFGRPYMVTSRLCQKWKCINDKLGLPNELPPREQFDIALRTLLPEGAWQNVAESVINSCYHNRTRMYTNTCPGQALMHCVVEKLHEFCPESDLRKDDGCSKVNSLANMAYMFSQSRYVGMKKEIPTQTRPEWFLKQYYESKCCNIPPLFNSTVLNECGFDTIIHHYENEPKIFLPRNNYQDAASSSSMNMVHIVDPDAVQVEIDDPMDCCDMSYFIDSTWRYDCNFELEWNSLNRLSIKEQRPTTPSPTTTTAPPRVNDVRVVPLSCEKEMCIFRKMSVLSSTGSVDLQAFTRFLDNFTSVHTQWTKAKGRVITECLHKPVLGYEGLCEINKILACTLDVFSENCPSIERKRDPCRNSEFNATCQISSAKFRPKNRRTQCVLPKFVPDNILQECGASSLSTTESVPVFTAKKPDYHWHNPRCQDSTESAKCLMGKMNVINKFGFMDYLKMKDKVRTASQGPWYVMKDVYMSAFINTPLYKNYCNSPKKLLNVIDTMLMTCPVSKRKSTPQCNRFFTEVLYSSPIASQNTTNERLQQVLTHFQHVFLLPGIPKPQSHPFLLPYHKVHYHSNPIYNFGILSSGSEPKVTTVDIKPKVARKPLVMQPVYLNMRVPEPRALPFRDSLLRSGRLPATSLNQLGQ